MRRVSTHTSYSFLIVYLTVVLVAGFVRNTPGPVFLADDPLWVDPDRLDVPAPSYRPISELYDLLANTLVTLGTHEGPALNVNTLGEVPNSSWYTNRHYLYPLSERELLRGPNIDTGPDRDGPWHVVDVKAEGKALGLHIVDDRGDRYILKFDPPGHPELSTGAEVIVTKFLHALGYHVPENYLVRFDPGRLVPAAEAGITREGLQVLLSRAPRYPDGSYRALASAMLPGETLGPFLFHGTRPDDANDIFPHEARRELRGLRVFAAWLNHFDARSQNTLDMLVREDGRQYVRHHLIDFGTTLGGSPIGPQRRWAGHDYVLEIPAVLSRVPFFDVPDNTWEAIQYPNHPAVGRFEADHFDPDEWVPLYPNPAFRRMDEHDAFWAAKQVMHFSDEQIRHVVSSGRYSDPKAARYIADVLIERRNKIGATYLHLGGGLDRFRVESDSLVFEDLLDRYGLRTTDPRRSIVWRWFDNETGPPGHVLARYETDVERIPIPSSAAPYLLVEIITPGMGRTHAYLRRENGTFRVVGVERCTDRSSCSVLAEQQARRARLFAHVPESM